MTPQEAAASFWRKVKVTESCWLWTRFTDNKGYGRFTIAGKTVRTHRQAWRLLFGSIPAGKMVCHRCDVPNCVRPDHLFIGSPLDNMRDMIAKGRAKHDVTPRGEAHHKARLSWASVDEIRSLRASGWTLDALGKRFGCTPKNIHCVVRCETWKPSHRPTEVAQ